MTARLLLASLCVGLVAAIAWLSQADAQPAKLKSWERIAENAYRTRESPYGYALVFEKRVLLIDATVPPDSARELGNVEMVLLTHHHRDTAAFAGDYRRAGVPVRAPRESAEWLIPENVTKYWKESIPLRTSRTAYFVLPEGVPGIDCTIQDGQDIVFGPWVVTPIPTPGHSRDHYAYEAKMGKENPRARLMFCGDAFHSHGRMWTPFTTDWDHWTDAGLKPAYESLFKLAKWAPSRLCPAHGPVVTRNIVKALNDTAKDLEGIAFLKSFERFTKDLLKDAPRYEFLVPKEQIASAGDKSWAKLSDHLWITGNTYVLKSTRSDGIFVLDPWGQRSADQIEKLRKDEKLGPVELVGFSHAHYDHFDGIHVLNGRDRCEVWGLDLVAQPLKDPLLIRAPFLDPRPIKFTREFRDGDTGIWGGYTFKFHHLPGQSWFTSGIETTIDGKSCLFTADNFFHQDQFSGSGGWMGLNRSSPVSYGASARKVLDVKPEWVLAEHGGPYVFSTEDFRRRVKWGEVAGRACDGVCVSGRHLRDWTPHRVTAEPVLQTVRPGEKVSVTLAVSGTGANPEVVKICIWGRGMLPDVRETVNAIPGDVHAIVETLSLKRNASPGRYIFPVRVEDSTGREPVDTYFAIDVVDAPR